MRKISAKKRKPAVSEPQEDRTRVPSAVRSSPVRALGKLAVSVGALAIVLLGGLWYAGREGQTQGDADRLFERGVELHREGKLEEAIAAYRAALQIRPGLAEAYNNMGAALRADGKLDEAVAALRTAIRLKPKFADAHQNLGRALKTQGKLEEAIAEYRTTIRLKPDDAQAHVTLGNALTEQGKLEEAIAAYESGIRIKPDYFAHYNLGVALLKQGKREEAAAQFSKAHEYASPDSDSARRTEREFKATED